MTWIKFAIWLCIIYTTYYGGLLLWDILRNGRSPAAEHSHELTFVEHQEPLRPDGPDEATYFPSAVTSGGVNLKQLFNLAREEAIEYTRAVSF